MHPLPSALRNKKGAKKMYKVLIVEDDPMVAMINEQYILKNKSFCVIIRL